MPNYFDNQTNWSWNVTEDQATVTTDHGDHTHTLDLTGISIGDLDSNTGTVMGDAHRAASHDYKTDNEFTNMETPMDISSAFTANNDGISCGEGLDGGVGYGEGMDDGVTCGEGISDGITCDEGMDSGMDY